MKESNLTIEYSITNDSILLFSCYFKCCYDVDDDSSSPQIFVKLPFICDTTYDDTSILLGKVATTVLNSANRILEDSEMGYKYIEIGNKKFTVNFIEHTDPFVNVL